MKKLVSVILTILLLLTTLPLGAVPIALAEGESESVVLNVKDFGAVGDGKTDDEEAIWATFESALMDYMIHDIPVTVYFPEGQYGLKNGGMYVYLPRGAGNLTIKGDGADKSTIVYLEEWTNSGSWVALRIFPRITPTSVEEYLHDITIQDLGVYDTDPEKHAWHMDKGDPSTEETHGFNIQHCVRATIKNCKAEDVGDECFDMSHCIDSVIKDNVVIKKRITGKGGGSLSVGDGSKNVSITNNLVVFDTESDSVSHCGVAVEALTEHVEDIYITNNTVQHINGWGVSVGAPNGTVDNVLVQNNSLTNCHEGGVLLMGTGHTKGVRILDNYISKIRTGILLDGANKEGTIIDRCVIENINYYAVNVKSPSNRDTVVQNVIVRNARWRSLYNGGTNTLFDRIFIDGSGTAGGVDDSAIIQFASGGSCTVANTVLLNCQNKKGIQGVSKVVNTYIQQPDTSGYISMNGCAWIENCHVNRMITMKSGGVIDGLVLYTEADLGTHAIVLTNLTDCTIKNCILTMPSRYGISEAGTADRNTITNNVCIGGSGVKTVGADTVAADNGRATLSKTEQFSYRVVDGNAVVMAPLDTTLTSLIIPATIDGNPVVAIDPWAFALCEGLTTVSIPDTLISVGDYAFYGCSGLTTVNYGGLEAQRESIVVGAENTALTDAVWTYHWENHNYDNACDPDCNDCPFIREVGDHIYAADCDTACDECGFLREVEQEHAYDNACDAACNACGAVREVPDHDYDTVVTDPDCVNDGYTTYTCTACGNSYVSDETTALGHSYVNSCDADCDICGAIREVSDHVYDDEYDVDCNVCGAIREVPEKPVDAIPGDLNGDSEINNRDLVLLQQHLNGWDVTVDTGAADVNNDGEINNRDLVLLQQYLNGWDVTLQ